MSEIDSVQLRRVVDKSLIEDVICQYAHGIDRSDWNLVRAVFHDDAYNDQGEYKGNVDGFIEWVSKRHAALESSIHFVSNCRVEFFGTDTALVETYFASRRVGPKINKEAAGAAPAEALLLEGLGRYVDRFERRNGEWRVAHRIVVYDATFTSLVRPGDKNPRYTWGARDASDAVVLARAELMSRSWPTAR